VTTRLVGIDGAGGAGEDALPLWEGWSEKEQRYWAAQDPRDAADEIVDGSGG